ncbi:hypothetical protein PAT3040_04005, partial [Paenibacillus agaridevorans]
ESRIEIGSMSRLKRNGTRYRAVGKGNLTS